MGIIEMRMMRTFVEDTERIKPGAQLYHWNQYMKASWSNDKSAKSFPVRTVIEPKNRSTVVPYFYGYKR